MHLQTAPTKNSLLVSFINAEWLEASFSISCPNLKETTETVKSLIWQGHHTYAVQEMLGVVQAQDKPTWMDKEHCLLPWQPDLITWVIRAEVHRKPTPLTRIYMMRNTGRQEVQGSPSTSAFCRKRHASPFVCGAAKILTDACTVRGQSEEINVTALAVMVQSLSKGSCAGFSGPSLWW